MRHTPGPWVAVSYDEEQTAIQPVDPTRNSLIAIVSMGEGRPDGEGNAALLAKAPDMYRLLIEAGDALYSLPRNARVQVSDTVRRIELLLREIG